MVDFLSIFLHVYFFLTPCRQIVQKVMKLIFVLLIEQLTMPLNSLLTILLLLSVNYTCIVRDS